MLINRKGNDYFGNIEMINRSIINEKRILNIYVYNPRKKIRQIWKIYVTCIREDNDAGHANVIRTENRERR